MGNRWFRNAAKPLHSGFANVSKTSRDMFSCDRRCARSLAKSPLLSLLIGSWTHPLGAAIRSDVVGTSPRSIFGFGVSHVRILRRSLHAACALRDGARAEGARGLGMADRGGAWTGPYPYLFI